MQVVATAGHVDHGKSTLLRALTGMEPDRWAEERRRGLTIDLGFVWTEFETDAGRLTVAFVDVPGHERFIANMLAGAGAVPRCLFVVAADDGWSNQSQEHQEILDLLAVEPVAAVVTKADTVSDERAGEVMDDLRRRLTGSSLHGAPVLAVDGISGRGLEDLRVTIGRQLGRVNPPEDRGRPRMWVDRAFAVAGAGTVATGTLAHGSVAVGDEVAVMPGHRRARIRGLQSLGQQIDRCGPGSRVAMNLAGIAHHDIQRGDAVVGSEGPPLDDAWRDSSEIDVWLRALPDHEIGTRGAWHLHVGSAETVAEVRPLLGAPARDDAPCLARVRLDRELPLVAGDRFVIRDAGRRATSGGGVVLDPAARGARGVDARLERAAVLETVLDALNGGGAPRDVLAALVVATGGARPLDEAHSSAGLLPGRGLPAGVIAIGSHLADAAHVTGWAEEVHRRSNTAHAEDPSGRGLTRDELARTARDAGCPPALAPELVDHLAATGRLVRSGSRYLLAEHADAGDEAGRRRRRSLMAALEDDPFTPPPLTRAASEAGLDHEEVNRLVHEGEIVLCGSVAFSRSALDEAVRRLRDLEDRVGPFTTAQARQTLGTSRRYAIPLLEHLDSQRITAFDGTTRRLRQYGS